MKEKSSRRTDDEGADEENFIQKNGKRKGIK